MAQSTIGRPVSCRGHGLHSGEEVRLWLEPAEANSGIVFFVPDVVPLPGQDRASGELSPQSPGAAEIPARSENVCSTTRATTLVPPGRRGDSSAPRVTTVEHLLAAIHAHGIDNLRIVLQGSEIPVFDGSAAGFDALLREGGRQGQPAPRSEWVLQRPIEIREGDRWIRVEPSDRLRIRYAIDFSHPCIGRQAFELSELDESIFARELASARTFGFAHEVAALWDVGLARGGSLENALLLDDVRVLNEQGLRWPDEFVRHKVVDLLGDLVLLGAPLRADLQVEKGGHALHHRLVETLLATPGLLCRCDQTAAA